MMDRGSADAAASTGDAALQQTDVLVVDGGPAGSTVATLLARRGHHVTLVEKDRLPRFHIGESLLPANLPLFEQLGIAEQVRAVEFQGDHGSTGVGGVRIEARHQDGRTRRRQARYRVDASGGDTFPANHFGVKRRNPKHKSAAIFGHFSGAERYAGELAGHISIYWFDHGWFWFIPLHDGATSVGADAVDACLRTPACARAARREFDRSMRSGPREFSWFIHRVTTPAMRELLLAPRNLLRMKEALLAVLAGDIFGCTPIRKSVRAFKMTCRLSSLPHPRRSALAARHHSINIGPV